MSWGIGIVGKAWERYELANGTEVHAYLRMRTLEDLSERMQDQTKRMEGLKASVRRSRWLVRQDVQQQQIEYQWMRRRLGDIFCRLVSAGGIFESHRIWYLTLLSDGLIRIFTNF